MGTRTRTRTIRWGSALVVLTISGGRIRGRREPRRLLGLICAEGIGWSRDAFNAFGASSRDRRFTGQTRETGGPSRLPPGAGPFRLTRPVTTDRSARACEPVCFAFLLEAHKALNAILVSESPDEERMSRGKQKMCRTTRTEPPGDGRDGLPVPPWPTVHSQQPGTNPTSWAVPPTHEIDTAGVLPADSPCLGPARIVRCRLSRETTCPVEANPLAA